MRALKSRCRCPTSRLSNRFVSKLSYKVILSVAPISSLFDINGVLGQDFQAAKESNRSSIYQTV